jgi:hypothetical protein
MGNEIIPPESSSWADVLQELNVPKLIAGPAGEAISRLVGHAVDIPSEYIKNIKQGIQDKRDARSEVSKALAKAAATEVAADQGLVHRAAQSFLAKELRSQANKEAVAKKAIEHLSHQSSAQSAPPKAEAPDDDWLNVFERYAENASSEKLRDLWARVLASEIRKPKAFSLRTMRFISELDSGIAQRFQKHANAVIDRSYILKPPDLEGQSFTELIELQDAGLLTGVDGNVSQRMKNETAGQGVALKLRSSAVLIRFVGPIDLHIPSMLLTNVGRELLEIIELSDDLDRARQIAEQFPKDNVAHIRYGRMNADKTEIENPIVVFNKTTPVT